MLFQPSNVIPDVLNGMGNGTVDLTNGLTVSWQVNGTSLMTRYRIAIFSMDAANTKLYETANISIPGGFSGVDYQGNPQRFTAATIPESTLTANGITNGNDYKIKLVLYYSENGTTLNTQQRSMSVFKARTAPVVEITTLTNDTLDARVHSFIGTYTQENGDSISWVRWQLFNNTGEADAESQYEKNLIFDSGRMYGVLNLQFDYDSYLDNNQYNLVLTVETENGIVATTSYQFSASWEEQEVPGLAELSVARLNRQSTAVKVQLENFYNEIEGDGNATTSFKDGKLIVRSGNLSWYTFDEFGRLSIANAPWYAICKFTIGSTGEIIHFKAGNIEYYLEYGRYEDPETLYSANTFCFNVAFDDGQGTTINSFLMWQWNEQGNPYIDPQIKVGTDAIMILTPTEVRIYYDTQEGGLTPSNSLTPSNTLQPRGNSQHNYGMLQTDISYYTQANLDTIQLFSINTFDYFQVILKMADSSLNTLYRLCEKLQYRPKMEGLINSEDQEFVFPFTAIVSDFENETLNARLFSLNGEVIDGFAVYRQKQGNNTALHLTDISSLERYVYDYGCGSGQGNYRYIFYPKGETTFVTDGLYTRWFNPVFENWSIIEASENSDGSYQVLNEFIFGKNSSSGSVSNNNAPTIANNFTRYATVQMANSNYKSGTLSSLIGYIGYVSYIVQLGDTVEELAYRFGISVEEIIADNTFIDDTHTLYPGTILKIFVPSGIASYYDDLQLEDDIMELSTTKNHLFLKDRKGDVMEIRIAGEITMTPIDASPGQELTASVPWVQIGDARNARLVGRVG
jgi:hypothetical protein